SADSRRMVRLWQRLEHTDRGPGRPPKRIHIQTPTARVDGLLRDLPTTVLVLSPQQELPGPTYQRVGPVTAEKAQGVQGLSSCEGIAAVVFLAPTPSAIRILPAHQLFQ